MTTDTDKLVEMALADAYEKGWCAAAQWANRDDLRHDTDSIAYAGQRDAILVGKAGKLIASLCGDVEPVAFMYPSDLAEFERKEMVAEAVSVSCTSVVTHERTVPLYSASTVAALKANAQHWQEAREAAMAEGELMKAELDALKAENLRLAGEIVSRNRAALEGRQASEVLARTLDHYEALEAERDAALARATELEKDAARLDAVEANRFEIHNPYKGSWVVVKYRPDSCRFMEMKTGASTVRAAIDAALAAKGQAS